MAGTEAGGPPPLPRRVQTFGCPNCGAAVTLRAAGQSLSVVCGACKSVIDPNDPNHVILSRAEAATKSYTPIIPLGSRGKLRGETLELIGYLRRCDGTGVYEWDEYLLWNPMKGFRWLVQSNGHWTLLKMTKQKPKMKGRDAAYLGRTYKAFLKGQAKVLFVLGELYWQVEVGEAADVAEYVCPPEILAMERPRGEKVAESEIVWSLGDYLEPRDLKAAFPVVKSWPARTGVAPAQPSPWADASRKLWRYFLVLLAALTVVQIGSCAAARSKPVFSKSYVYDRTLPSNAVVTDKFTVDGRLADLEFKMVSDVKNAWLSLEMTLINDATGEATAFEEGVEYYSGYDSDGSWSEGSIIGEEILSRIPAGTYYLTIMPTADPSIQSIPYQLDVTRDVPFWSNFWFALLILAPLPVWVRLRHASYESRRWSESDL